MTVTTIHMSEISDLMASNDPMATSVMSIGPSSPINTTPSMGEATAQIHESQVQAYTSDPPSRRGGGAGGMGGQGTPRRKMQKLNAEQREAFVATCCAFIVLLPNIQQMLLQQVPVLGTNNTLLTLVNASLVGILFFGLREHILDVL